GAALARADPHPHRGVGLPPDSVRARGRRRPRPDPRAHVTGGPRLRGLISTRRSPAQRMRRTGVYLRENALTPALSGSYNPGTMRRPRILCVLVLAASVSIASAHVVYVANDNHTDYGWNATTTTYDGTMLTELDYYLSRISATSGEFTDQQARFNADCWWYLWLYEHNRTPSQFAALVNAMQTGHIQVPLNPFVTLYGALPTEAAIRAGYYPGR